MGKDIDDDIDRYCNGKVTQDSLFKSHDASELARGVKEKLDKTDNNRHAAQIIGLLSHIVSGSEEANIYTPYLVNGLNKALACWITKGGQVGQIAVGAATNITHGFVSAPEVLETDEKSGQRIVDEGKATLNKALLERLLSSPDHDTLWALADDALYLNKERAYEVLKTVLNTIGPHDRIGMMAWIGERGLMAKKIDIEEHVLIPYFQNPPPQAVPLFQKLSNKCPIDMPVDLIATLCFSGIKALQEVAKEWAKKILDDNPDQDTKKALQSALPDM